MSLRFAIIGCGRIGQRHAGHIQNLGKLAAVCDIEATKAEELGKKHNANIYTSIEELLGTEENLDVIAVCTPNGLHAEHSIKALKAGVHVLCEKPMGLSIKECGEMIKTAEKANKRLFVVKQNRFNPPVEAVKKLLDEDKLGKIFSVQLNCFWNRDAAYYHNSWKGTKRLDGGTLFTQFSHFIDLLYWMVGDVKRAKAFTGNYAHQGIIEFEDTGAVILEFDNGVIGTVNYTVNSYKKNMEGSITIFGEKGTIKIGGQYLNVLEYQNIEGIEIKDLPAGNKANDYGQYQGSMSNHDKVYENLVQVLENNAPISANSFEGFKTVEIIEKIYTAAQTIE
ncbi:MAG TPA: Gfo/Idh/MocA family oxidoreductase [Chitinophagaceae bacterium]|nr:Gfo/Idh/MocA family oxidoreductase [Chitinophagaceae bacterium]